MKLSNFTLEGKVLSATLKTKYFTSRVVLSKVGRTKWTFGVKSLAEGYKNDIKRIFREIMSTGEIPTKALPVKAV